MTKKFEPKPCMICKEIFTPISWKNVICGKKSCQSMQRKLHGERVREAKSREEFSKGRVWILNMETWEWKLKVHKNHDMGGNGG